MQHAKQITGQDARRREGTVGRKRKTKQGKKALGEDG